MILYAVLTLALLIWTKYCQCSLIYEAVSHDTQSGGAGRDGIGEEICGAEGYDINNLTRADYWQFTNEGLCLVGNQTTNCTFFVAFCKRLLHSTNCSDSSVCQQNMDNPYKLFKVGGYRSNPFESATVNGFFAGFPNGSNYTTDRNQPCNVSTLINLKCDSRALWQPNVHDSGPISVPSPVPGQVNLTYFPSTCSYLIEAYFAGACFHIKPSTPIEYLSSGTILILIFVCSLFSYFLLGSLINMCQGARGKEMLPNSEFWVMLPVWIADGFIYTFTCRMCSNRTKTEYDSI